MIPQAPHPPCIAARLVDLFTFDNPGDAIRGDLLEEFLDLAAKSGAASARHWYWRQAVKTVMHLAVAGFRTAPWLIAGAALSGLLFGSYSNWLIQKAAASVLHRYEVYAYVDAYVFWRVYSVSERLVIPMLMGCMVAIAAKRRELAAAITLSVLSDLSAVAWGFALLFRHPPLTYAPVLPGIISIFVSSMFILIGGVVVRTINSAQRPNATKEETVT